MTLEDYGYGDFFSRAFAELDDAALAPGRVVWTSSASCRLATRDGEMPARLSGRRFRDCSHGEEPGCAVTGAVAGGRLSEERLASFRALQKELRYLELRQDESAKRIEKQKWRAIHREMRKSGKHRRT